MSKADTALCINSHLYQWIILIPMIIIYDQFRCLNLQSIWQIILQLVLQWCINKSKQSRRGFYRYVNFDFNKDIKIHITNRIFCAIQQGNKTFFPSMITVISHRVSKSMQLIHRRVALQFLELFITMLIVSIYMLHVVIKVSSWYKAGLDSVIVA